MSKSIKFSLTKRELDIFLNSKDEEVVKIIKEKLNDKEKCLIGTYNREIKKQEKIQSRLSIRNDKLKEVANKFREDLIINKTESEKIFEVYLKLNNLKYEFQKIVYTENSFYIVDFYLPDYNLVVEIDGGYHFEWKQKLKDKNRTKTLISIGFRFVKRIKNEEVKSKGDFIAQNISKEYLKIKEIK